MKNSKHTLTRVLACIMVVLMTVAAVPLSGFSASAAGTVVKSGNCGKNGSNVSFTLYSNGTLKINGSGEMEDYKFYKYPPYSNFIVDEENNDEWYGNNEDYEDLTEGYRGYDETIKKVVVRSGITSIGNFAFASFKNLVSVSIPNTAKGNTFTLLKLTKGRTYYFKVAAFKTVGSKNLYGSFSTAKAVKIK